MIKLTVDSSVAGLDTAACIAYKTIKIIIGTEDGRISGISRLTYTAVSLPPPPLLAAASNM
jgi:hypothetical protein